MLPFGITGRIILATSLDPDTVIRRLVAALETAKASEIHQTTQGVTFHAGLFRLVSSMNPLVAIGSGSLAVRRGESKVLIDYALSFRQLFFTTSIGIVLFFGLPLLAAPNLNMREAILLLAGAWVWLYGGNVALVLFRFPRWLRRASGLADATRD